MKRRWKKFLAGVLSAALALNLAAPLALADGVACRVTKVFVYPDHVGRVNSVNVNCIQGEVSYNQGVLTFDGDVTLDTTLDSENYSLVKALSEENLRLVANGKVTGRTKSNGFDGAKEIVRGEYDLTNTDAGNQSKGILGATNDKTTIASDTRTTLKGFQTGIGWGSVQIDGKVKISSAACGIANFTTMNHGSEEEARLFEGWFLEDGTRLEDSPYYMGPGANHVGNLDRDVTFYGHWRTAESGEGSPDGGDGFGTLLAVGAVVGVAGVVAYQVGTELILDQLLPAGVAVPHTRAELAMLLWNTAGRPAPAALAAFADVADPELAQAAQWAIEQGYLKARADGSFKPDKGVAKWRVIRGYRAVTEP